LKVVLLPQARDHLDEIFDPVLSRVVRRLRLLERFPEMGAPMAGPFAGYRSTIVDMFRIVYRVRPRKIVEIAYIRDCRRAPPA
jgi:plasmid stabilization system protein ParE